MSDTNLGDINSIASDEIDEADGESLGTLDFDLLSRPRFIALELTNFLSYKSARLEFGSLIALVGPNASGKSNAVAAIKLLREIPTHGLPTAVARRGGFDQLRHRSAGHPNNPSLRLSFSFGDFPESSYELSFAAVAGKRYRVKHESATIRLGDGAEWSFVSDGNKVTEINSERGTPRESRSQIAPGQSALSAGGLAAFVVYRALQNLQTVEINPARVADLQVPSSTREFEADGSNIASVFEALSAASRVELADQLSAIVPGISRIEPRNLADRQTLEFVQGTATGNRRFFAKQMSDGTLRAFGILLSMLQPTTPSLLVIEEPEVAIHLGALRTLVDILEQYSERAQVMITTHSADIIDALDVDSLRVVWNDSESSHIARVAEHTKETVRKGLMSPGELLRADSLDPSTDR